MSSLPTHATASIQKKPESTKSKPTPDSTSSVVKALAQVADRIVKANLPSPPYFLTVEGSMIPSAAVGHRWVDGTPFSKEEGYLQYQTLLSHNTSDTLLRVRSSIEIISHFSMTDHPNQQLKPNRAAGGSNGILDSKAASPNPTAAKKKISLKDYNARKQGTKPSDATTQQSQEHGTHNHASAAATETKKSEKPPATPEPGVEPRAEASHNNAAALSAENTKKRPAKSQPNETHQRDTVTATHTPKKQRTSPPPQLTPQSAAAETKRRVSPLPSKQANPQPVSTRNNLSEPNKTQASLAVKAKEEQPVVLSIDKGLFSWIPKVEGSLSTPDKIASPKGLLPKASQKRKLDNSSAGESDVPKKKVNSSPKRSSEEADGKKDTVRNLAQDTHEPVPALKEILSKRTPYSKSTTGADASWWKLEIERLLREGTEHYNAIGKPMGHASKRSEKVDVETQTEFQAFESLLYFVRAFALENRHDDKKTHSSDQWRSLVTLASEVAEKCKASRELRAMALLVCTACRAEYGTAMARARLGKKAASSEGELQSMLQSMDENYVKMQQVGAKSAKLLSAAQVERNYSSASGASMPLFVPGDAMTAVTVGHDFMTHWANDKGLSWKSELLEERTSSRAE